MVKVVLGRKTRHLTNSRSTRGKNRVETVLRADLAQLLGQSTYKSEIPCIQRANDDATESRDVAFSGVSAFTSRARASWPPAGTGVGGIARGCEVS